MNPHSMYRKQVSSQSFQKKKPMIIVDAYIAKRQTAAFGALGVIFGAISVLLTLHSPSEILEHIMSDISYTASDVITISSELSISEDVKVQVGVPIPLAEEAAPIPKESTSISDLDQAASDKISNLVDWMESHGLVLSNNEIVTYDASVSHRGMHATRDLRRREMLLSVPNEFIITSEKARASPIGKLLEARLDELAARHVFLALFLMEERSLGNQSWWHSYIDTLPKSFRNMPMNFDEQEIALMEGSCIEAMYDDDLRSFRKDYEMLCEKIPEVAKKFSFEDFKWGRLVVLTRAFSLTIHGKTVSGLVPFADMYNHAVEWNTFWHYSDDLNAVTFNLTTPVPQGGALSISYGNKGNEILLINYGFALPNNLYNKAVINIGFRPNDPLLEKKVPLARSPDAKFYSLFFKISASPDHPLFRDALNMCRLVVATEEEYHYFLPNDDAKSPVSLDNEMNALLLLEIQAKEGLSKFPQSMQFDETLLEDPNLSTNQRNIVLTRHGEKQTLHKIIDLVDSIIPLLQYDDIGVFNRARLQPRYRESQNYLRQIARIYRRHFTI